MILQLSSHKDSHGDTKRQKKERERGREIDRFDDVFTEFTAISQELCHRTCLRSPMHPDPARENLGVIPVGHSGTRWFWTNFHLAFVS